MAVGKSQHRPSPAPGPTLGEQLLPRINGKALAPFCRHGPPIATGPNLLQQKAFTNLLPQQQGATFIGKRRSQHLGQLIGQPEIRPYQSWRL